VVTSAVYLSLVVTTLWGGTIGFVFLVRHYDQLGRDTERVTYRLEFPADLTPDQATAVMRSLTMLRPAGRWLLGRDSVVFEVVRHGATIEHRLRLPRRHADHVAAQIRGLVPSVRMTPAQNLVPLSMDVVQELALTNPTQPLRVDAALAFAASLLLAMGPFDEPGREQLVFQVVAYPLGTPNSLPTHRPAEPASGLALVQTLMPALAAPAETGAEAAKLARAKLSEPLFGVSLRVGARSTRRGRSGQLVGRIVGTLHQLDRPGVRFVTRYLPPWGSVDRLRRGATAITAAPIQANAQELATLVWPLGGPTAPGLQLTRGREFPPQRSASPAGYVLGRATYPGMERLVAVSPADALMHMLISGPTGSGKSTLLLNVMKQQVDLGHGLVLIDPNGDLARDFIEVIPQGRVSDLIYLNPTATDDRVVPLNPLACALEDAELVADQMLQLIRDRSDSWGVVIEETLKNTLVLLAASPGMTLAEIPAVLVDEGFRVGLVSRLDPQFGPTVGEFFARFEARSDAQKAQDASAVLNKVTPLLDRRPIRAMLGQAEPTWTMRQVIDERKLLVVALPSGVIGESAADIIGSTIATMVWNAALGRVTVDRSARQPVSLVIDELPRFVRGGFGLADMLARARAHGIGLVGALQHLAQVNPQLRAALLSEARNKVVFQPAADDASLFARHMLGVHPEDLLGLAPRTALASLVAGGQVTAPVSIATFAPPEPTGYGEAAQTASRTRYGRDRAAVEQAIQERRHRGRQPGPRRTRRLP
jgi:hypothetical protein